MTRGDREDVLLEAAAAAWRELSPDGRLRAAPAWWDLAPDDRDRLHRRQIEARLLEAALDPDGHSSTVKAVLARLP
ncbi:MAG: hypothetical protein PVF68_15725 [Acidobacteriota bacterium]|jgi:hypothetical protein